METNSPIGEVLECAFLAAFLLTGSSAGAERAVLEGLANTNGSDVSGEGFFHSTLSFAIAAVSGRLHEKGPDLCGLPEELHRIMRLPPEFRHSFVLRFLLRLPVSQCSSMLSVDTRQFEYNTVSALRALAALREPEAGVIAQAQSGLT
jgi:hypothetical protein